jgi:hypothetical protein
MRIALAQINNTIGDLEANAARILDFARRAEHAGAELVAFPELALTGYPPRDLVEKRSFLERTSTVLDSIVRDSANLAARLVIGYVGHTANPAMRAQNSAAVIEGGRIVFRQSKMLLPNYDAKTWFPGVSGRGVDVLGPNAKFTCMYGMRVSRQLDRRNPTPSGTSFVHDPLRCATSGSSNRLREHCVGIPRDLNESPSRNADEPCLNHHTLFGSQSDDRVRMDRAPSRKHTGP